MCTLFLWPFLLGSGIMLSLIIIIVKLNILILSVIMLTVVVMLWRLKEYQRFFSLQQRLLSRRKSDGQPGRRRRHLRNDGRPPGLVRRRFGGRQPPNGFAAFDTGS
jgi:hypothetical protein